MKKDEVVSKKYCDFCGEESWEQCLGCGKDICWECQRDGTKAKEYHHGVYVSGTSDGAYCLKCDAEMKAKGDPVHAAYLSIEALREEAKEWDKDFTRRREAAEKLLEALLDLREKA